MPAVQNDTRTVEQDDSVAATADDMTEEVLVEEVSIDGMCGVY
ncbi:mycofactocin precursor MftA [Streptomyces caeni]|uniref:Mycofactocin MftA n=1 Tax=Streptomyces caeni TaxID=2307231 RepID=A0ABW4ILW2_9ACTN